MTRVTKYFVGFLPFVMILIAASAGTARAQGSRKDDVVFNAQGRPMAGATVRVCTSAATGQPCTPLALIYSDAALTQALANPLPADGLGNYNFYATPGRYMIEISGPGITTKQIPNVILPNDPSSPTFTSVTTTSGISAFSLSLTGNLTVTGSTAVAGALTVGGAPVPSTGADNQWSAAQRFKGPVPHRDVTAYGASGSIQTTTTAAIFTNGSTTLTLTSALDFLNGHGVRIVGAGTASALAAPGGLAVVQKGTAGATTYQYQIACVDAKWGETAANTAVSIANGNATLTYANFNQVTWSASASCIYYAVYGRQSGGMTLLGITPNLAWYDYGQANMSVPSTLSAVPPASAQIGFYYGTITAGGGTTTLTMDTAAGTTLASGALVEHDDSDAVNAAINAAATTLTGFAQGTQDRIFFPPGNYNITKSLLTGASNNLFMLFMGSGRSQLFAHVPGISVFLVNRPNQDLTWQSLGFSLGNSTTAVHYIQIASALRTKFDLVSSTGSAAGGSYTTFFRNDTGQIIFNMNRSTIANDVNLRFGEPGFPVQIDDIHIDQNDFYDGANGTNAIPGVYQFVNFGSSGTVEFTNNLIEGPVPTGTSFPWFRMANCATPSFLFKNNNFATENNTAGVGATFQGWPGFPSSGQLVFEQNPIYSIGTGGIFDWSAGTGGNPQIILRESSAVAGGGAQVFHAASDMSGLNCYNSSLSPTQTLLNGYINAFKCFGLAGFTNNSNQIYLRGYPGANQDPVAIDDPSGNPLFHLDTTGGIANSLLSRTAPTISSGFGTSPSVTANNGTAAFRINVGTGGTATSGVIGLPTAANGWNCYATDITTNSASVFLTKQTASTTTTATLGNFNTSAAATAWTASDILAVSCFAF